MQRHQHRRDGIAQPLLFLFVLGAGLEHLIGTQRAGGVDYQVNRDLLVGLGLGGTTSSFSVPDRATGGNLDAAHVGVYGVARHEAFYAAGSIAFAAINNRTNRTIAGVGPTETANASFASDLLDGRFELGYRQRFGGVAVTPFAAVEYAQLRQSGFTETTTAVTGAPGVLGLAVSSRTVSSLPTFVGAQIDSRMMFTNGMMWSPYARVSWVHELQPTRDLTATLVTVPLAGFTVSGPRAARDAARLEAGAKLAITQNAVLFGNVLSEFSDRSQTYAGKGGLRVTW